MKSASILKYFKRETRYRDSATKSDSNRHMFGFKKRVQAFAAEFASPTAHFHAAETARCVVVGRPSLMPSIPASIVLASRNMRLRSRVNAYALKPNCDEFASSIPSCFGFKRRDRSNRRKSFFLHAQPIGRHIDQNGRLRKSNLCDPTRFPPQSNFAPRFTASSTCSRRFRNRVLVNQRADLYAWFHAVADFHRLFRFLGEPLRKFFVNAALHINAIGRDARLAGIAEFREHRAIDGFLQIGVVEHQHRIQPAEFERQRLQSLRRARNELFPTSVEPVNVIFRTSGFSKNSAAISEAEPQTN